MKKCICCIALAVSCFTSICVNAADGIWNRTDNTDLVNPASWTNSANWVGGVIADGIDSEATFTNAYPNKAYRAVEIAPDGVKLGRFWFKNHDGTAWDGAFLKVYGGPMWMEKSGGDVPRIDSTSDQLHIYSSVQGTNGLATSANWSVNLFGNNSYTGLTTVQSGYWITRFGGVVESSSESLYDFASTNDYDLTGGRITFYGRKATSSAITSNWSLVEGSAKATYVSGLTAGSLTTGSIVSAPGLPEGTFVKQITDASNIVLSNPSETNASSHALGFSAVDSKCYQNIGTVDAKHNNSTIMLNENGANELRVDVAALVGDADVLQRVSSGQASGVLALHDTRSFGGMYTMQSAWLELPKDGADDPVLSNITVTAASTLSVPDAGAEAFVPLLTGDSSLSKTGAGKLKAQLVPGSSMEMVVEQGALELNELLLEDAVLHLDASMEDTITLDGSGNVAYWADADGRANGVTNSSASTRPSVSSSALNGLPAVDFGSYNVNSSGDALFLQDRITDVRTVFIVYYGRHNEAVMLGEAPGIGSCGYSRSANPNGYIWGPNTWTSIKYGNNNLDGETVDSTTTVLPLNEFHLVSVSQTGTATVGALGNDRNYRSGGQMIAEVILFDRSLSTDEQAVVDSYLREKWFDVEPPVRDQIESLELKDGTRLVLPEEGTFTVGSFIASGDVILEGPGKLRVSGSVQQSGTITFENGGGYEIAGLGGLIEAPQASMATNPVFWVDACSLTNAGSEYVQEESGTYYVSRWDDVRGSGYNYATNVSRRPTLRLDDVNGLPSVYFHRNTALPSEGETMPWDVPLDDIRAVFMVVGSQEGGGILLGSTAAENTYDFYRGAWSDYNRNLLSTSSSVYLQNGGFYINGHAVDPTTTGYNGYFQLIEAHPTGPVRASAFAGDRFPDIANGNGCQRIAEMILYTRELSDQERLDTAEYLMQKWLNRPAPYENLGSQVAEMSADSSFEISLAETNDLLDVAHLDAAGGMVKSGDGTVVLRSADMSGQLLDVRGGRVVLYAGDLSARVPDDAWMHVDASLTNTVTFTVENGTNMVTKWEHADGGSTWAQIRTTATRPPPLLVTNALNGLPVIDFREYTAPVPTTEQCFLEFSEACSDIREVIMVFGSEGGGNTLLGSKNGSYRHFYRTRDDFAAPMLGSAASVYLRKGESRKNGEFVNPASTGFSGGFDVVSLSATVGSVYSDAFANDVYAACGGQQLAEVFIFDRALSLAERLDTEAYLMQKWKGVTMSGYESTSVGSISVAANAVVEVIGEIAVSGISGSGTVEGALILEDGAVISVAAESGAIDGLNVTGDVTLLGGGSVNVSGDVSTLDTGEFTVLSSDSLNGSDQLDSAWSVTGLPASIQSSLSDVNDEIIMRLSYKGTVIIVR